MHLCLKYKGELKLILIKQSVLTEKMDKRNSYDQLIACTPENLYVFGRRFSELNGITLLNYATT